MAKSFRDLEVWKMSIDLTALIYELTSEFPKQEIYGLTSQMRCAAVSIASNIAEGSARGTRRDFKQFVKQAEGSNCELQTQLTISKRLGFGRATGISSAEALSIWQDARGTFCLPRQRDPDPKFQLPRLNNSHDNRQPATCN